MAKSDLTAVKLILFDRRFFFILNCKVCCYSEIEVFPNTSVSNICAKRPAKNTWKQKWNTVVHFYSYEWANWWTHFHWICFSWIWQLLFVIKWIKNDLMCEFFYLPTGVTYKYFTIKSPPPPLTPPAHFSPDSHPCKSWATMGPSREQLQ